MTVAQREQEETSAQNWSATTGIPYLDSRDLSKLPSVEPVISLADMDRFRVAPLHFWHGNEIEFGMTDQTDRSKLPALQLQLSGVQLTFKTISRAGYNQILNRLYLRHFDQELAGNYSNFGGRLSAAAPKAAFQIVAQLAYLMRASDVHIEPSDNEARIRFRIDGTLHPIASFPLEHYKVVLADLQTRAQIKWGTDHAQAGRISYDLIDAEAEQKSVDMRIETIPTFHGEEIVVRIFNTESQYLELQNLGFSVRQKFTILEQAAHPNGLLLTVGPTGSGKTSTLYALINELNGPEVKVVTLEDPVEYDLPGISQIPIRSDDKELFAEKLRAVLREDPNIIMIGEIRDMDTATTALQAALTGHLVLSTFHAASAAAAISRLMDMISDNPLMASAIRLIMAQRLVRRVCPYCSYEIEPTKQEKVFIGKHIAGLPSALQPKSTNIKLHRGKGCPKCHGIGYLGRTSIVEQLVMSLELEKMIQTGKPTTQDLEAQAIKEGMTTMLQDGLSKVLKGETTLEEVQKVL